MDDRDPIGDLFDEVERGCMTLGLVFGFLLLCLGVAFGVLVVLLLG